MGSDMKQTILDTARHLFTEKGFHGTSMRDIAAALNISVGNLTYHYKKKEELIEAIILKEHERYEKLKAPRSLKELNQFFLDVINQKNRRPYYFKHYVELSQICPTIYKMQLHVLMDLHEALRDAFDEFVEKQLLKKEFSLQYHGIISIIMTFMIHGLPDFYQTQEAEGETLSLYCFWSIILPCLSEKGREEYKTLNLPCPDFSLVKP
ncbi:MAG: TetR/AcrR family transcriptional regulator [Hungatella sp.]|jgi:AcrR family transcriptional regulator|nr:TetR/AcrR family transcriptional regulator [Hungatella sp.]